MFIRDHKFMKDKDGGRTEEDVGNENGEGRRRVKVGWKK